MSKLYLSELAIYPVKSLAQITLDESRVDRFGLAEDRRWMVVDKNGRFITQRQHAEMCLVQPEFYKGKLKLKAPGMTDLIIAAADENTKCKVVIWEDECNACDCGDKAAAWLSRFLEVDCRLMFFPAEENRPVDRHYAEAGVHTAFSDGFPLLLVSQASLDDLNSRLDTAIPMLRFRPNLVVSGCEAFAEDGWRTLRIGELTLHIVKPCSRCGIPGIDVMTAKRSVEPAKTLSRYRRKDNKIFFGQNVIAEGEGFLQKGMPVEIVE